MSSKKGCCISAVRASGLEASTVSLSGSTFDLLTCFEAIVASMLRNGIPYESLLVSFMVGRVTAGDDFG